MPYARKPKESDPALEPPNYADINDASRQALAEDALRSREPEPEPVRKVIVKIMRGYWPFHWPWNPDDNPKKLPVGAVVELPEDEAIDISDKGIAKMARRSELEAFEEARRLGFAQEWIDSQGSFPSLSPEGFSHPADQDATKAFRNSLLKSAAKAKTIYRT